MRSSECAFTFIRNCWTLSHSGWTISHPHRQRILAGVDTDRLSTTAGCSAFLFWFEFVFLQLLMTLCIFPSIHLLCKLSVQIFSQTGLFLFLLFLELFTYIVSKSFIGFVISQYFHPVSILAFHVVSQTKVFYFDEVHLLVVLTWIGVLVSQLRTVHLTQSRKDCSPLYFSKSFIILHLYL